MIVYPVYCFDGTMDGRHPKETFDSQEAAELYISQQDWSDNYYYNEVTVITLLDI
jgi:hypothetical protein